MDRPIRHRDGWFLVLFWVCGVGLDLLWLKSNTIPPAWDQGDHLSRALGLWRLLQQADLLSGAWWHSLWAEAPSYRGPLTGLVTAPVLQWLGPSYNSAVLSNSLFHALLLVAVYGLGRQMHGRSTGLWAAALLGVAPALLNQRSDYLIDFSYTAVLTASWWLLSWRVLRQPRPGWWWSALVGLSFGLITLTRATGLLMLWLPLLVLAWRLVQDLRRGFWRPLAETALAAAVALALVGPWFAQNWLTILTSVNMARRWGLIYQDGLEANTIEGWLWYPRMLPTMVGALLFAVVLAGGLLAWRPWSRRPVFSRPQNAWPWLWWLSFPLGALLLDTLMTTKDIRFALPLVPQLLLGLALVLCTVRSRWAPFWRLAVVAAGLWGVLGCQFGVGANVTGFPPRPPRSDAHWPLAEIVAQIRQQAPHQLSSVVVVPDSNIYLNPFNLEAEGRRQAFRVAARQTVATPEQLADELAGFGWFLLQGNLPGQPGENLLTQQVPTSAALLPSASWTLPDGSRARLFRKRSPGLEVQPEACPGDGRVVARRSPAPAPGGLQRFEVVAPASLLREGLLWLAPGEDHAIGQGLIRVEGSGCLLVRETLQRPEGPAAAAGPKASSEEWQITRLDGQPLAIRQQAIEAPPLGAAPDGMPNRISQLRSMGQQLRQGALDPLFARIGQINQQDPEQIYLAQGERLLQVRLRQHPEAVDDWYALALAQAIQRKAAAASQSLERIVALEPNNPRGWMGLGFLHLYRFQPGPARQALDRAASLDPHDPALHTLRTIAHGMGLELLSAWHLAQHPPAPAQPPGQNGAAAPSGATGR